MASRVKVVPYDPLHGFGERGCLIRQAETRVWACALNSFATAAGISSARLESVIGHDGGKVIDEDCETSERFAAFTDAELIRALWQLDVAVVQINFTDLHETMDQIHWRNYACQNRCVIYYWKLIDPDGSSLSAENRTLHAVACYDGVCCDVSKEITKASDIPVDSIEAIYVICDLTPRL